MINIVMTGPPGSGKGTQSSQLAQHYNLSHVKTGEIIRNRASSDPELQQALEEGELIPDKTVREIIDNHIANTGRCEGFIFDGFPRTVNQAKDLDKILNKHKMDLSQVIFLDIPEETAIERISKRAETSGREDDQDRNIIRNRLETYYKKTEPLIEFYKNKGILNKVDGAGSIDEIFERIKTATEKNLRTEKS